MNEIRAFVGHSFTPEDTAIIGWFLKYFDQIKGLHPTFAWEHAEAAEPRELAGKVLSLIADKNVFIGICTKKERVVGPRQLLRLFFQPTFWKAKDADLLWKTSDWIIQEIGLAIGRNMALVLLIEEGVRPPGGLQGNVEYITFSRDVPERASGKILEMIRALSPRPAQVAAAAADSPAVKAEEETPDDTADWSTPKSDWTQGDFKRAMFFLLVRDRPDDAARIDVAYLATEDARIGDNKAQWEANAEYIKITFGKGGNLEKLKGIADTHPKNKDILFYLAMSQAQYGDHQLAAATFQAAASTAETEAEKQRFLGFAATHLAESGAMGAALAMVEELRAAASVDSKIEKDVLGSIRRVAEISKDDDAAVAAMERIVEISPGDTDVRFSLAFKHSELGNEDLALHHYLRIPFEERNPITWNNLGVSFDHFTMPAKSVDAYRRAEKADETLAMSNIGQKFLAAGFLKEARAEFDRALTVPDYHKNIGLGISRLKEIPDDEDKKEAEVLQAARKKVEFYKSLGRAIAQPRPVTFGSRWEGPDCQLAVSVLGDKIKAVGSYEQDTNSLLAFMAAGQRPKTKYSVEYEGVVTGRQIEGTVRRVRDGDTSTSTLLSFGDTKSKVLIIIADNGVMNVMENPHGTTPSYYEFRVD